MDYAPSQEWAEDPETEDFRQELARRQDKVLARLLNLCRMGDNLLEIKRAIGQFDAMAEIATMTQGRPDE